MKSIKVCEYSRSRLFHYDLILQDQASGERSQDQWSSGLFLFLFGLNIFILHFKLTCILFKHIEAHACTRFSLFSHWFSRMGDYYYSRVCVNVLYISGNSVSLQLIILQRQWHHIFSCLNS